MMVCVKLKKEVTLAQCIECWVDIWFRNVTRKYKNQDECIKENMVIGRQMRKESEMIVEVGFIGETKEIAIRIREGLKMSEIKLDDITLDRILDTIRLFKLIFYANAGNIGDRGCVAGFEDGSFNVSQRGIKCL